MKVFDLKHRNNIYKIYNLKKMRTQILPRDFGSFHSDIRKKIVKFIINESKK
jgi:hypothetical protein